MNKVHLEDGIYPKLARQTVENFLAGEKLSDYPSSGELGSLRRACFVTIKTESGALRGCIGTIWPAQPNLGQEIMANAISAATRDPRFSPLTLAELPGVIFSVDVLSPPEPVSGLEQLDPAHWGVIVTRDGRRGLLLPDLEGVDTVEKQLTIAAGKAGLRGYEGAEIQRFSVTRFKEK